LWQSDFHFAAAGLLESDFYRSIDALADQTLDAPFLSPFLSLSFWFGEDLLCFAGKQVPGARQIPAIGKVFSLLV
jgi:hypothetical protein